MGGACCGSGSGRGKMRTVRMWRGGGEGGIGAKISHSPCHKLHMVLNCSGVRNIRVLSLPHCKSPLPWYNFFSNTKLKTSSLISTFSHFATLVMGISLVKYTNLHHSLEPIQLYLQLNLYICCGCRLEICQNIYTTKCVRILHIENA